MPQVTPPTPLRRRKPVAPGQPGFAPWRSRLLNYALGFVTIVLVVDALVGDKGLLDTMRARRQHAEISTAIGRLKQDNNRLRDEIRRYREDPSAIEALAREELGLMREGEVLFIVRDVKPFDRAQAQSK
jgi:cell division protein FtsB